MTTTRMPTLFLPHGGGPWTIVDVGGPQAHAPLEAYLRTMAEDLPARPSAILCVSAHWEEDVATVQTATRPPMLYDYYGFPQAAYAYTWPAPGAPDAAAAVKDHLASAGIATAEDGQRGFDHGTFVPLMVPFPEPDIPTFQVSLLASLDAADHLALGRALAPLRDRGVLIVGSGMSYHNVRQLQAARRSPDEAKTLERDARTFDDWLAESVTAEASAREQALADWAHAPAARPSHPREEHLLPLMVAAGAAGDDAATLPMRGRVLGAPVSAVRFG
ncbi:MAG: class III extradiol ring-cleavage dioxygenase [Myxococcota bacterium]